MAETSPSVRRIMISNGDSNKPIWITEFGSAVRNEGVRALWRLHNAHDASPSSLLTVKRNELDWCHLYLHLAG